MEDLIWIIYFIDVLSSEGGFTALSILLVGAAIFSHFMAMDFLDKESFSNFCSKFPRKSIGLLCVVLFLYGWLVPSKDTAYKMLAAYGVYELTQNEQAKTLGGKSLKVIEAAMDEYLKDSKK